MTTFPRKFLLAMLLPSMTACASVDMAQPALSHQDLAKTGSVKSDAGRRAIFSECSGRESPIFSGEVEDGFGMTITVCVERSQSTDNQMISVLYSGEGGGRAVSCFASDCQEKIEFRHYRRFRFSELTLLWRDENGVQRLLETFDAQMDDFSPRHSLRHTWVRSGDEADLAAAESFSVNSDFAPLSLIVLDRYLNDAASR